MPAPARTPSPAPRLPPPAPAAAPAHGDSRAGGHRVPRGFDELVAEAAAVSVDGWDFSWLDGRATEERPPWRYARTVAERMARARAAVDIETGGGEVLAGMPVLPPLTAATESWPPNVARATERLYPRGAVVVATGAGGPLPFGDGAFGLAVSRHPVRARWDEIARLLRPGGTYLSQEVGPASVFGLVEYFLGPRPPAVRSARDPEAARAAAEAAGLDVVGLRTAALHTAFHDIGAVVYFLRTVVWKVPDFTVERCRDRLARLHTAIRREGSSTATTTRFLIEARKPSAGPA
ncbi:SAM-dependent methyltransferase [Streptomyces tremellae]|uniref:Class I SAM-dependent methyltransferase n=1 Tax=Streptomyces tremellae TaxID=1124239 RepID=A0ABP7G5J5_9ACTN